MQDVPASGRPRILVVEDEFIIVVDIWLALEEAGAEVVGLAVDAASALALARDSVALDGAILDINLRGELVYQIASVLAAKGVPFIFVTGCEGMAIPVQFAAVQCFRKPVTYSAIVLALLKRQGLR